MSCVGNVLENLELLGLMMSLCEKLLESLDILKLRIVIDFRRSLEAGELLLKEKPLLTMTTPHTPKTLAKYVAELRQKVSKC